LIDGVIVKDIPRFSDERGWLSELFRSDDIKEMGGDIMPAMSYVSMTLPGVVRGPHEHREQTDYFCFVGPSNFKTYLWDARPESSTKGEKLTIVAGEDSPKIVIVPPGVVHAYKNVGDVPGFVFNAPSRLFMGEGKSEEVDEIRHEDKDDKEGSEYVID
jgi:dTDP-4-dehydrorhamnose 3,5-epimerase